MTDIMLFCRYLVVLYALVPKDIPQLKKFLVEHELMDVSNSYILDRCLSDSPYFNKAEAWRDIIPHFSEVSTRPHSSYTCLLPPVQSIRLSMEFNEKHRKYLEEIKYLYPYGRDIIEERIRENTKRYELYYLMSVAQTARDGLNPVVTRGLLQDIVSRIGADNFYRRNFPSVIVVD